MARSVPRIEPDITSLLKRGKRSPFDRKKNGSNELISEATREQPVETHPCIFLPSTFLQSRHVHPGAVDKGDLAGFLGYLEDKRRRGTCCRCRGKS